MKPSGEVEKVEERCLRKLSSKNLRKVKFFTVVSHTANEQHDHHAYIAQNLVCGELYFELCLINQKKKKEKKIFTQIY